jgi:hypothetical protein
MISKVKIVKTDEEFKKTLVNGKMHHVHRLEK